MKNQFLILLAAFLFISGAASAIPSVTVVGNSIDLALSTKEVTQTTQ